VTGAGVEYRDGLAIYRRADDAQLPVGTRRVVFVHGTMDRASSFGKVSRRLPDVEVVRYDRRGYGRSTAGVATGIDQLVADLMIVIGDEESTLVGHSLGGVVALAAAERAPHLVKAVASFEAPMPWKAWWPQASVGNQAIGAAANRDPEDAAEVFMRRIVGDRVWERLPPRTRAQRRSEGEAMLADLDSVRIGEAYDPSRIVAPVVSGYGDQSDERHRRAATELSHDVAGTALVVVAGAGHGAHASHPDEFAHFVRRAVERGDSTTHSEGVAV
jgi:pimeloyl-ACP methyl ester carboxylesterase